MPQRPKNTRQAYRADIRHYEQSGMVLPATPEDIVNYLQLFRDSIKSSYVYREG
jgi:hypothetical protein